MRIIFFRFTAETLPYRCWCVCIWHLRHKSIIDDFLSIKGHWRLAHLNISFSRYIFENTGNCKIGISHENTRRRQSDVSSCYLFLSTQRQRRRTFNNRRAFAQPHKTHRLTHKQIFALWFISLFKSVASQPIAISIWPFRIHRHLNYFSHNKLSHNHFQPEILCKSSPVRVFAILYITRCHYMHSAVALKWECCCCWWWWWWLKYRDILLHYCARSTPRDDRQGLITQLLALLVGVHVMLSRMFGGVGAPSSIRTTGSL